MTTIHINGQPFVLAPEQDLNEPLLWYLRDQLNLTGTKFGCGQGLCGACTVHMDGVAIRSCITPLSVVAEKAITTIEGLKSPLKAAWVKNNVPQCGYCQSGQMMAAASLLAQSPKASRDEVRQYMAGNLCRCGSYHRIEATILEVQEASHEAS